MEPLKPLQDDFVSGASFEKKGITYTEDQIISDKTIRGCTFINCCFERLYFESVDFGYGVKFIDCKFLGLVGFYGCKTTNYDAEFNFQNQSIEFNNCELNRTLSFLKGTQIDRDLLITSCTKVQRLIIYDFISERGSLKIFNSSVVQNIDIHNVSVINDFSISKTNVEGWLRIRDLIAGSYVFSDNSLKSKVWIWAGTAKREIIFNNGLYYDDFDIKALKCDGGLSISGDTFKKSLNVKCYDPKNKIDGGLKSIYLKGCSFDNGFYFDGTKEPLTDRLTLNKIKIEASSKLSGIISIKGVVIAESLLISGVNKEANLIFEFCQIKVIHIHRFSNYNQVQFINIASTFDKGTEFRIEYSYLGSTLFHGVILDSFESFEITDSIINDILTTSVRWFSPVRLIEKSSTLTDFQNCRDIFRQLKFAMLKQGDRVQALYFKKYEMIAFQKELKNSTQKRVGDKLMMWLNKSNDYGQNWIRPAFIGFICTCFIYIPLIISTAPELTSKVSFEWADIVQTLSVIPKYFKIVFKLLNPAHNYETLIQGIRDTWFGLLLDYIQRIIIAYFIFQVVSAFRKYIKD